MDGAASEERCEALASSRLPESEMQTARLVVQKQCAPGGIKVKKEKKELSPIERSIANKEKLVGKLKRDIQLERERSAREVKRIEFRLQMTQTFLAALKRGTR
jgi:hypothetical protein